MFHCKVSQIPVFIDYVVLKLKRTAFSIKQTEMNNLTFSPEQRVILSKFDSNVNLVLMGHRISEAACSTYSVNLTDSC